jgi:hypothetical protein
MDADELSFDHFYQINSSKQALADLRVPCNISNEDTRKIQPQSPPSVHLSVFFTRAMS